MAIVSRKPVNIDSLRQKPEEKGAVLKDVSTEQAKIIKKMVLDKKNE